MSSYREGQRWVSESEPELGLGTVVQIAGGRVGILFPATGEMRLYAEENAPLKRVRFREGDTIQTHDDESVTVEAVREADGLLAYVGGGREVPEAKLSDRIRFHGPDERLLNGLVDKPRSFSLRRRALEFRHRRRKSPVRGFVGGRIDLIPHQLYIADEVSSRHAPRVLLSDEVGLGKTIEACLILHRLLQSGRAARVLILVPDSLVHQWFVEMLRKFNLWLHIFDEERCASIEAGNPGTNPFLDDQLVLCSIGFLAQSEKRSQQALEAGWDVLVVDEAHHLEWSGEHAGPEYRLVESLSRHAEGLLLLTATPEQLGLESHFARLRLLDPDRYSDFAAFQKEAGGFQQVAAVAERIVDGTKLTQKDRQTLKRLFRHDGERLSAALEALDEKREGAADSLLTDLLDLHGPGRVVFRNTRASMSGFPKRIARIAPLEPAADREDWIDKASMEFAVDAGDTDLQTSLELEGDPRVGWLASLLKELEPQKVLVICRSREKAHALDEALRGQVTVKTGVFHEELTLIQRDRNAAWFAEEEGARLLICSEIGSEGRNFQFAHHLVLFDLPLNPELLEQRIGRLDRIGQTEDIRIHIPFLEGSPQEVLARWYHEGLDAFETNLEGGNELLHQFGRQVHDLALEFPVKPPGEARAELGQLLAQTANARTGIRHRLEQGRDRLLEWNSFRPKHAAGLVEAIRTEDESEDLEEFLLDVFDHFGVHAEDLAPRTYQLSAQGVTTDAFPSIPDEGMTATFDRARALSREDVGFLGWDHPIVTGSMDLLLGSEKGNSTFAFWPEGDQRILLLEAFFVLETVAPGKWHLDRFLPPTPLRVVVNHKPAEVTDKLPEEALEKVLRKGRPDRLLDNAEIAQKVLPAMIDAAQEAATSRADSTIRDSREHMNRLLGHEVDRLVSLRKVNDHIRPEEIDFAREQMKQLDQAIRQARPRLDALRLIARGPF